MHNFCTLRISLYVNIKFLFIYYIFVILYLLLKILFLYYDTTENHPKLIMYKPTQNNKTLSAKKVKVTLC